jgi:hypothetical protein
MRVAVAVAAILAAIPAAAAHADERWYLVNEIDHICTPASKEPYPLKSPLSLEQFLRKDKTGIGEHLSTEISRDNDGAAGMVFINFKWRGKEKTAWYFRDKNTCEQVISEVIGTPSELR